MTSAGEFEALLAGLSEVNPAAGPPPRDPVRRVAVLGAGPVGQALACECLAAECEVTLYTAFESERARAGAARAVTVRGEHLVGTYRLADGPAPEPAIVLRTGIDDAVADADAILLAIPAVAHATAGGLLAGRVSADQLLVLVPGRSFGAVEVARSLRRFGATALPTIVELAASPYRVQSAQPGALTIAAVNPRDAGGGAAQPQDRRGGAAAAHRPADADGRPRDPGDDLLRPVGGDRCPARASARLGVGNPQDRRRAPPGRLRLRRARAGPRARAQPR